MSKIFVRERKHVGEGAGRPRFAIVAAQGTDLHVYHTFIRRAELEKLAEEMGAEIVHLPRGEQVNRPEGEDLGGRRHRRHEHSSEG